MTAHSATGMPSNLRFSQPTASLAANRNNPRRLPPPIIPQLANMSFRHPSTSQVFEPRPKQTLPSLGQVFSEDNHTSNIDVLSPRLSSDFMVNQNQDQNHGRTITTQISSAQAAEVMQKTMETIRKQIHDNGFTDEDIRKANELICKRPQKLTSSTGEEADDDYQTNPYEDRAGKIGLRHHIPGIGHLGHLLTPPGWKAGEEPISPKRARELYREAYDAAKKSLADSIGVFKHLKGTAFQKASDRKNEEWQNETDLAKLILEERIKVYQMHQERKWQQSQPVQEPLNRQAPALQLPSPDIVKMQDHLPAGVTEPSRYTYGHHPYQNGFLSCNGGAMSRPANGLGQPEPSPKMKQCLTRYGRLPESAHPQAQRGQSVPHYMRLGSQADQMTLPAPQHSPYCHPLFSVRDETHQGARHEHKEEDVPISYRYGTPPGRNGLGIHQDDREDEPVELALSSPLKQFDQESKTDDASPQTTNESGPSPEKVTVKKRTPQKSAVRAGLAYDPKAPRTAKVTGANLLNPSKKRRRHGEEVPVPAHIMPPETIRRLFASNLPMKWIGKGPNPYLTENGAPVAVENGDEPSAKKKSKSKVETTAKAPVFKTQSVASDISNSDDDYEEDTIYGDKAKNVTPKKGGGASVKRATPRKAKTACMGNV
ncbi:MAG: hypothetical protein Q9226_000412 [Calogaya cf. arnoldii]